MGSTLFLMDHNHEIRKTYRYISDVGRKAESRECSISRKKGEAFEKCFRQAVSEIVEIPRAQAAAARMRNEKFELA